MTQIDTLETVDRPQADDLAAIAERFAQGCARTAQARDDDDSFVADNYKSAAEAGLLDAGVPSELGGGGADVRALADMLRRIAHGCSSTALALSMHSHQVAFPAWRWHHQQATRDKTEPLLKRVTAEKLVLLSSGGGDWIGGSGKAEPVEGGYRITARKMFVSGAPAGDLLMTSAVSPEDGGTILHFPCPMTAPEVSVLDTWHTLGMRGTGSHDVMIEGLFVPAEKIAVKRPQGQWHPVFFMLGTIAFPLIYAVYLGVAERARDLAVEIAARRPASALLRDRAGRMETALTSARLAHQHMVATCELNAPSAETVGQVMTGRRLVEENAIRTVELALELAGGAGFYRKAELERLFRDVQAARYHPLQKEIQAEYVGALALGHPVDRIY
ncbi:acyl-CoA dehydrogenase family protein [Alloyangia pacifica]|uniref:Acyl-CoA dehydrogenase n=1 Tax=Alloyangia pacifica TaxID=311180 RepID=A0A1I6QHF9_9RHOB|nr:acyl-CoA dehydrogenase family protein [Alloyangia pacifica]SDF89762.1 Acyl-CoA dehydrogenase [Alloyangia pacifica]SFS51748.1 Acyl-CoA dehydrogenase [Alloyangia pacifica]